jgi:mycothiol synthase
MEWRTTVRPNKRRKTMATQQAQTGYGSLQSAFEARPASMDDLESTVQAIEANFAHLSGTKPELLDTIQRWWQEPGFNLATDSQLVLTPQGGVAGYCEVWDVLEPPVKMNLWLQVHPDYRNDGIGRQLLSWAEGRSGLALDKAPAELRIVMHSHVPANDESTRQAFTESGFNPIRYAWTMVLQMEQEPHAPEWPAGIRVRAIRRNEDEVNVLRAVRESFKDHWGYMDTPFEEEQERWLHNIETDGEFDPSLWFLAMDGEEIAGVSLCKWKDDFNPEMGWVNILGVRRPWRRQGVALALLQHSFREFYARGRHKVGLGVDAQSLTGATRLYEKAGMYSDPSRELMLYEKELRPGMEIRTQSLSDGGP